MSHTIKECASKRHINGEKFKRNKPNPNYNDKKKFKYKHRNPPSDKPVQYNPTQQKQVGNLMIEVNNSNIPQSDEDENAENNDNTSSELVNEQSSESDYSVSDESESESYAAEQYDYDSEVFEEINDNDLSDIQSSMNLLESLVNGLDAQPSVNSINASVQVTETLMTANINQNPYKIQLNVKHPFEQMKTGLADTGANIM